MKAKAVDFVCYNVADMGKALGFYRDALGLTLAHTYEGIWAEFEVGGVTLALCGPPWGTPPQPGYQGGASVALAVDDVRASVDELRGKGVTIVQEAEESPVCLMATVADPDGNRLFLHQRKDGTCG